MSAFFHTFFDHAWQLAGLVGAITYICNYLMIAMDRLSSRSPLYYFLQLTGATLVMISLTAQFNMAAAIVQGFFILVSLLGIFRHLRPHTRRQRASAVDGRAQEAA